MSSRLLSWSRRITPLVALLAACSSGGSGDGGTAPPGPPASVTLQPNPATLQIGDSVQMNAVVKDASGTVLSGLALTWQTVNQSVATVTAGGKLHAIGQGSTSVTALTAGISGQATVNVTTVSGGLHPVLSTFIGGSDEDMVRDVTVDSQGNIIMVGNTASADFPTTPGVFDPTFNCCTGINPHDAWVTKLTAGGGMIWSSYLGGINYERAYAVETDSQGYLYVAGRAGAGFPVTPGVFQPTFGGGTSGGLYGPQDGFVCKITPSGASIVWCSYLGIGDQGILRDIALDSNGDIYVGGGITGSGLPSAWFANAYQKTPNLQQDMIIAKIKNDGTQVLWATYLGGSGREQESVSLRVDSQGNVVVLTTTDSPDMPLAAAAKGNLSGPTDMYLAKLSPDGSQLLYATYLGGSGGEASETHGLWLDSQGNAFVVALTSSADIQTAGNAFQKQFGGGSADNVVWKVSPAGALLASTYVGGSGSEGAEGAGVDSQGNFYFASSTDSPDFPLTVPSNPGILSDIVGVKLSSDLSQLRFSIRYGGSDQEYSRSAVVDAQGNFYVVGQTRSADFPVLNALQPNFGGMMDGILIKVAP
jgi:hypothetical protein